MNEKKETVEVGRRRHTGEAPPGGRPRAEAPQRPSGGSQGGAPSGGGSSGGGFTGSSGGAPMSFGGGSGKPLSLGASILVLLCIVVLMFMNGGNLGQLSGSDTNVDFPTQVPAEQLDTPAPVAAQATPTRKPTARPATPRPATAGKNQTWTVMLYEDADDKILEQDIFVDLNEAERVGSSDRVQIVAQVDRFRGAFQGDGDWTSTRRYYITQDDNLNKVSSKMVADLGEVNMSSVDTLVDFVAWAAQNYPADKYVLILSDHGMGWPGGWSDPAPGGKSSVRAPLAARLGNELYLVQLDQALEQARQQAGIDQFELVGMDACLMAQLEVFTALVPHARYAVASEEVEPALGWAYTGFLGALQENPDMDGAELSRLIVENYIENDQRIVDEQARAEFLRQGSPFGGFFGSISASRLAQQMEQDVTLSAIDLAAIPNVVDSLNNLAYSLQGVRQVDVARSRNYAQAYTNIFGNDVPSPYIDLGSFLQLVKQNSSDNKVLQAASNLQAAIQQAVLAEKHGPKKPGSTGIAIYFPNSDLYNAPVAGPQSYTVIANRFAEQSLWDDFLAFHYTGEKFEAAAGKVAVPSRAVSAPGLGAIEISPIQLSSPSAAPGDPVTMSADVNGQNIGHIYLFVGYIDETSNSIFVNDMDYLESRDTREVSGVYYPVWPESGDFTVKFEWEPVVFAINDSASSIQALFQPRSYGATFEQAIYTVDGIYTYADSSDQRYARLIFSDGAMTQVLGFSNESGSNDSLGAPREIVPQAGDTFTVLEKWIPLDASGNPGKMVVEQGATLTFGADTFRWEELSAAMGRYIVGFIVEDLDGNTYPSYAELEVK